jgi:hypothetical protein
MKTQKAVKKTKKIDWEGWREGLRMKLLEAGGASIVTLLGTNGVDALNIPGLNGIGMNYKTTIAQFVIHLLLAAGSYMRDQKPNVIVEEVETTMISRNQKTGEEIKRGSKSVITTPVTPEADINKIVIPTKD